MKSTWLLVALTLAALPPACLPRQQTNDLSAWMNGSNPANSISVQAPTLPTDAFVTLKSPADAHAELCAADSQHPNFPDDADIITRTFCADVKPGGVMPTPHGLSDLLTQLGVGFKDPQGGNGTGGNPAFAILGHSSALTARKVTTIAPTAFVFTPPPADGSTPIGPDFVAVAYDPGEQFVEVAAFDPGGGDLNFYLVLFDQACTSAPGGCTTTDLLTPRLVTGWSNVRVYEDSSALGNTIFDCRTCHKADDSQNHILRMQEIESPFTHWFSAKTKGGAALLQDFHAAHGTTEDYGPIPAALVDQSDPSLLAAVLQQGGYGNQPNAFPSAAIEAEVDSNCKTQPASNVPPGWSSTWSKTYENAASGQFIAAPYHDVKVTDPTKLEAASGAYREWLSGNWNGDLPDTRDVFLDEGLRDMGFAPRDGLDGPALVAQMCQQCHQSKLDMTVSRERFLVDQLGQMSRAEKDVAIVRLQAPVESRLHMPPVLFRTITNDEKQRMIDALSQ
jgi:hypothetical protein